MHTVSANISNWLKTTILVRLIHDMSFIGKPRWHLHNRNACRFPPSGLNDNKL